MKVPSRRRLIAAAAIVAAAIGVVLVSGDGGPHGHRTPRVRTAVSITVPTTPPTSPAPTPAPAAPGPPALSAPAHEQFGVNVNRLFNDRTYSPAAIELQLRALRHTGATVARSDTLWEVTEPSPPTGGMHHYQWSFDDEIAGTLAASGLRWVPIVDYAPVWASRDPTRMHSPPRSPTDFATFAAAVAARYGRSGSFWHARPSLARVAADTYEIWNEPDGGFWPPAPDASAYAELYLSARDAITAVDPTARVVIGGLTGARTFLPALLRARPDLRGHIDGVAIHPYGTTPAIVLIQVRFARTALTSLGLRSVPLYVTEFGWTTQPRGALNWILASQRPGVIAATIADLGHTDCTIAATILYTWVTPQRNPADREDWYGIHSPTGGASPDASAFALGILRALEPRPVIRMCAGA